MLNSSLCDYSDTYTLAKGTMTITGAGEEGAGNLVDERNKLVIFKNFAAFIGCINEISNTQVYIANNRDAVMLMYNLLECSKFF